MMPLLRKCKLLSCFWFCVGPDNLTRTWQPDNVVVEPLVENCCAIWAVRKWFDSNSLAELVAT